MAHISSIDFNSLAPYWVSVIESGTQDDRLAVINHGTKIQSTDGNNGNHASGYVKGTARGKFKIQFKLGYSWCWSSLYAANVATVTQSTVSSTNAYTAGYNGLGFINNNSNNDFKVYSYAGTTSTTHTDITGISDVLITLWRDSSNVVYYKAGSNSTVTLGTFADHWCFYHAAQSPCAAELICAHNLSEAAS